MSRIYEALEVVRKARQNKDKPPPVIMPQGQHTGGSSQLVVSTQPNSSIAESFRFLRSKIIRPATGDPIRTLLVSSALKGEGKTFVASNLAAAISQTVEEYALLIDADIRSPSTHRVFGMPFIKEGLSTYLTDDASLADVLRKSSLEKLTILPAGNSTRIPAELLSSERMRQLIREVRDRYTDRFIIIDSPPLELAPECSVIANEVDAVLLIIRYGQTSRSSVRSALNKIRKDKLLGVVFNCYEEPAKRYGSYRYYYGYGSAPQSK